MEKKLCHTTSFIRSFWSKTPKTWFKIQKLTSRRSSKSWSKHSFSNFILKKCLKDTVERCLPFWTDSICNSILNGKRVLVVAHGNSLRAIVKYLDDISDEGLYFNDLKL